MSERKTSNEGIERVAFQREMTALAKDVDQFAHLEFRNTTTGRQAFIQGTRVAVWMLIAVARQYGMDVDKTARHLGWTPERVQAGLAYYAACRDEIDVMLQEYEALAAEPLTHLLPTVEQFSVTGRGSSSSHGISTVRHSRPLS